MEKEIISDYVNSKTSIEKLASKYKVGKIKIKKILLDNNIEINKIYHHNFRRRLFK